MQLTPNTVKVRSCTSRLPSASFYGNGCVVAAIWMVSSLSTSNIVGKLHRQPQPSPLPPLEALPLLISISPQPHYLHCTTHERDHRRPRCLSLSSAVPRKERRTTLTSSRRPFRTSRTSLLDVTVFVEQQAIPIPAHTHTHRRASTIASNIPHALACRAMKDTTFRMKLLHCSPPLV